MTPRIGKIYVISLTTSWQQVLTKAQARAIVGFKIKSRYDGSGAPGPFDLAFLSSPSSGADSDGNGYWSNTGAGVGDFASPSNGLWAKSTVSGTLLEVLTYG